MKSAWTAAPSGPSGPRPRSNSRSPTETTAFGSGRPTTRATTSRPRSWSESIRMCSASRDRMGARRPSRSLSSSPPSPWSSSGDGVGCAAAVRGLDPGGGDVLYHPLDITDRASISAVAKDLPALVPRLDLLVNNAGIGSWGADRRASARTIATNYFGSRDVTDALLPFIPEGGRIVMVSSGLGELSYMGRDLRPRFADASLTRPALDSLVNSYLSDLEKGEAKSAGWPSAYSVSKVAMNALTRILARELAPRKITINSVCPGWVRTDMGGPGANRSVEVGARSIVLGAMLPEDATGGFYRDGKRIPW